MTLTPLEPRDCPTTLTLSVGGDPLGWWTPERVHTAESVAADLSAKVDVPGFDEWTVSLTSDPATPLIAYATGISGAGYITVGPAVVTVDLGTVLRHEMVHSLGVLDHADDPAAVLWPHLSPGEVRGWTASDDAVMTAGGLVVNNFASGDPVGAEVSSLRSSTGGASDSPGEVYPYTEAAPYRGPLVYTVLPDGWAWLPPRVAEAWGYS